MDIHVTLIEKISKYILTIEMMGTNMPNIEEVFRLSGVPTYTFVNPQKYNEILVSVRTPGRCVVIEGPSGIGKTSTISRILSELGISERALSLSARRPSDLEYIADLPNINNIGIVIVDDFHRLPESTKESLSNYMKILADTEDPNSKLIIIGINKIGQQLIRFAPDLNLRVDIYRLEANPIFLLENLIKLGEAALNIRISTHEDIASRAQGSFQLVQLICHKLCVLEGITRDQPKIVEVNTSINIVIEDVLRDLSRSFKEVCVNFARGSKLRKEGRAPYLHILRWLSESEEWSIDLNEAMNTHASMKASISQVIEKGYLTTLLSDGEKTKNIGAYFHFEPSTAVLSVEDPKLVFYLKNLIWRVFTHQVGFKADYFGSRYDFALSFAGADRNLARTIFNLLTEREISVFYDENEQHRILSMNVEDYLAPIYRTEAKYIIVLQSKSYPTRIWTKFESDTFKERFGSNEVIPIRYTDVLSGYFSDDSKYGGISFDPSIDTEAQAITIVDYLSRRIIEDRNSHKDGED